jgi:hypothetical protein
MKVSEETGLKQNELSLKSKNVKIKWNSEGIARGKAGCMIIERL